MPRFQGHFSLCACSPLGVQMQTTSTSGARPACRPCRIKSEVVLQPSSSLGRISHPATSSQPAVGEPSPHGACQCAPSPPLRISKSLSSLLCDSQAAHRCRRQKSGKARIHFSKSKLSIRRHCIIRLPYQLNISPSTNRAGRPAHSSRWASLKGKGSEGKQYPLHSRGNHVFHVTSGYRGESRPWRPAPPAQHILDVRIRTGPHPRVPPDRIGYLFRKAAKIRPSLCPLLAHFWAMSRPACPQPTNWPKSASKRKARSTERTSQTQHGMPAISRAMTS